MRAVVSATLAVGLALASASPANAHVVITEGDVAIVAIYTGSAPAEVSFQFVTLSDFHIGEAIGFTDRGWQAAGGFRTGDAREGDTRWDVDVPTRAGTVIFVPARSDIDLERRTDQVFAHTGTIAPDGTFSDLLVYGLNLGGPWAADATSSSTSALPPGLSGYEVALDAQTSCAYSGPTSGSKAELLALIGDAANWTCSDTMQPSAPLRFTVLAAQGDFCADDADCADTSNFCANGVCCDTECGRRAPGHCATCDFGPADPRTGTCQAAPDTFLCRTSGGPCDPSEMCDGVSTKCPADELHTSSAVCRASAGACDPEERCTGMSAACPGDVRADPSSCDDGDPCTADGCTADGTCIHAPVEGCGDGGAEDGGGDSGADTEPPAIPPVGSVGGGGCEVSPLSHGGLWPCALLGVFLFRRRRRR